MADQPLDQIARLLLRAALREITEARRQQQAQQPQPAQGERR